MDSPKQDPPSLEPSSVVGDTYRIENRVARGGSSIIYTARHVEMDRKVALKVLPLDPSIDASALERFSQEARLTCQINHPNVVTIYQFGQDARGVLYLAMEWLDGTSLAEALDERGAFSPFRVAQIGRQVARGLAAVHDRDVLHRDLKPSNVMLAQIAGWKEIAKLLDFGVAKSLEPTEEDQITITQEGKFVGTPRYAAPELIRGEELSPRTDIYSTGLLMWEALVGEPAVTSVVFQKCCAQHLSEDPWELPESTNCPAPLERVIHRSLRKDPEERFESCRELSEALGEAIHELAADSSSAGSTPVAVEEGATTSYGSQWMKLLFAVAVGVTALGLAGYQGWLSVTDHSNSNAPLVSTFPERVRTSDELVRRLTAEGWSVVKRQEVAKEEQIDIRYELERGVDSVTMYILDTTEPSELHPRDLPFSDFSVRVDENWREPTSGPLHLMAELYALRAADAAASSGSGG